MMRRTLAGALAIALLASSPAAAQDASRPYDAAVAARQAGNAQQAIAMLEPWVRAHPEDVDARLQLAYALLDAGALDRAEQEFARVLAAAPDYQDARTGLQSVAARRTEPAASRGFVMLDGALGLVDGPRSDWKQADLTVLAPIAERDLLEIRAGYFDRGFARDVELGAGYVRRAGDDLWLRAGGSFTPSADFRPKVGFSAGADYRLSDGPGATIVGMDLAWRSYPAQDVWIFTPSLTQYLSRDFSVTVRPGVTEATGEPMRVGVLGRADYYLGERTRFNLGAATGPDTDLGYVTQTTSVFGGGEVAFDRRLSAVGSLSRTWRDGAGDRTDILFGLKVGL